MMHKGQTHIRRNCFSIYIISNNLQIGCYTVVPRGEPPRLPSSPTYLMLMAAVACRGCRARAACRARAVNVNIICLLFKSFIMDGDRRVMSFVYSPRYFLMFRV
jgi:hypothetical protein